MNDQPQSRLAQDLVLPTLLFAALGAMTWAVRGCSGFGAMKGCIFAGVTWGAAWWFIAHEPRGPQSRPYASGWIILALLVGIGFSGNRGWMQWPSFFAGHLQTNTPAGRFVPIPRVYGFVWLFIAGVPWAGLGACLLAWCGTHRTTHGLDWVLRIAAGVGMAILARSLFDHFPKLFLPLYDQIRDQYADLHANPNLKRLINDNRAALTHLGLYLGFLGAEMIRRDWRNTVLILVVGILNGTGWALCQNWHWASELWPGVKFNWWRCWESCGGISIGIAYGVAYYLVNRPKGVPVFVVTPCCPNWERAAAYGGLLLGLSLSFRNGLKGWANIYLGNEEHWDVFLWKVMGPALLAALAVLGAWLWRKRLPNDFQGDLFPRAYSLVWVTLILQNAIAQLVTGPWSVWNEAAFSIYYALLFLLTGGIVYHFQTIKRSLHGAPHA